MNKYRFAIFALAALTVLAAGGLRSNAPKTVSAQDLRDAKAVEYLKKTGGYDSLKAAYQTAQYRVESKNGRLSVENPANLMRARFEGNGNLRLSGITQNWQTTFRLKSLGRGAAQSAVGGGRWRYDGNRAELRRDAVGLTEYFENRADGLEQGFIVDEKPAGDAPLNLILETDGGLLAEASADGQRIVLTDESGAEVLAYEKLKVWDAANKDVSARMRAGEPGAIRLEVDDREAVYPLTIDPTFNQRQRLTPNGVTANDNFGGSVAISGDTAVIGAQTQTVGSNAQQGAAFVFVRSGNLWTQQAMLAAGDGAAGDSFGNSVAISGETIVVGSYQDDIGPNAGQGSAYAFIRNGTSWTQQDKFSTADGAAGDEFGFSVSIAGDTALVGAPTADVGTNTNQGAMYVFVRSGGNWVMQQKLTAADGATGDNLGYGTELVSNTALAGAPNDDNGANVDQGSVYAFTRTGNVWSPQTKLTSSDGAAGDRFGVSLDMSYVGVEAIAVIGAQYDDIGGNSNQGSAYVFTRGLFGNWSQTQKLTAGDGASDDWFGGSVAVSAETAETIVVGAQQAGNSGQGAAYVFKRGDSGWTLQRKMTPTPGISTDIFGESLALSGKDLIVGTPNSSTVGAAFMFKSGLPNSFDFDGDTKADVSVFRPSNGQWWYLRSSDGGASLFTFGTASDLIAPNDITGDGRVDIAVFRPSNGNWYVMRSEDNTFLSFPFGTTGDLPRPADYDGDGLADPTVFRPSTGTWYISQSSGGTAIVSFGASGDVPVPADYDGDGKADVAIFRPADGSWWYLQSSDGQYRVYLFGVGTDKPEPGDYTGDGKADIAVFRPASGTWYIQRSEDNSYFSFPFGTSGDVPVAADYDGDGRFDSAVFRPSNKTWYMNRTTNGVGIQLFGATGDTPVPSAFVP